MQSATFSQQCLQWNLAVAMRVVGVIGGDLVANAISSKCSKMQRNKHKSQRGPQTVSFRNPDVQSVTDKIIRIWYLQSKYCNQMIAIRSLQTTFCKQRRAIKFVQSIIAVNFLQSTVCSQAFAITSWHTNLCKQSCAINALLSQWVISKISEFQNMPI